MAMSVQQAFVAEFFASAFAFGSDVVDFNDIGVLKEQSTPATFPLLFAQEDSFHPIAHGMVFEPLAPGEEITIIRAGRSLDFDVLLDVCLALFPSCGFLATELPALSLLHMPVFVRNPAPSFVWVTIVCPPSRLEVEDVIAGLECFCCHCSTVVIGPSPMHPVELVDELFLGSVSVSFHHHFHRTTMAFDRLFASSDDRFETKWLPARVLSRVRLAHRTLSDGPPQKSPRVAQRDALSHELALDLLVAIYHVLSWNLCQRSWKPAGDMGEATRGADWLTTDISLRNPWEKRNPPAPGSLGAYGPTGCATSFTHQESVLRAFFLALLGPQGRGISHLFSSTSESFE